MCGIVGAVAKRDVVPFLIDGLKRLEYRGYDSAGIAVLSNELARALNHQTETLGWKTGPDEDLQLPSGPLALDATDLVCALNSRGELVLDLGDEVIVRFRPEFSLVLQRFMAGNTFLEQMAQRGEL